MQPSEQMPIGACGFYFPFAYIIMVVSDVVLFDFGNKHVLDLRLPLFEPMVTWSAVEYSNFRRAKYSS